MVRNVVILGSSYAGSAAARLLAATLPNTHRVVLIDRQRFGVGFVPLTNIFDIPLPEGVLPPTSDDPPTETATRDDLISQHVLLHASVVEIGECLVKVDRDLEGLLGEANDVEDLAEQLDGTRLDGGQRRIEWDYLVYALGYTLPEPLLSPAWTKTDGVAFLRAQQARIAEAESILIIGGGALGIQYASDITDLYLIPSNAALRPATCFQPKKVTLVHSHDRFLPFYDIKMHEQVMRRMEELGVEVILGERVVMPSEEELAKEEREGGMRTMKLDSEREVSYDLLMKCTGQLPSSKLPKEFLPSSINERGFVEVQSTMLVALPEGEKARENVFVYGDVANAGVIQAGHTGWGQACIVVQNVVRSIKASAAGETPSLLEYTKTIPQIKVSLGLHHSVSQALPTPASTETVVKTSSEDPLDGYWNAIWTMLAVGYSDPSI